MLDLCLISCVVSVNTIDMPYRSVIIPDALSYHVSVSLMPNHMSGHKNRTVGHLGRNQFAKPVSGSSPKPV